MFQAFQLKIMTKVKKYKRTQSRCTFPSKAPRDAGTGGAGGATAPLAFSWKGQGGQKCPLSVKKII